MEGEAGELGPKESGMTEYTQAKKFQIMSVTIQTLALLKMFFILYSLNLQESKVKSSGFLS